MRGMAISKTAHTSKKGKATTVTEAINEEKIRMNVNIPKSFYKKIKQKALDEDSTVTDIVMMSLKQYIEK